MLNSGVCARGEGGRRLASSTQHRQGNGPTSSLGPVGMSKEQSAECSGGLVVEVEAAVLSVRFESACLLWGQYAKQGGTFDGDCFFGLPGQCGIPGRCGICSHQEHMCIDICIDMRIDMHIDMYTDLCTDMCMDMCMDMCIDMYINLFV